MFPGRAFGNEDSREMKNMPDDTRRSVAEQVSQTVAPAESDKASLEAERLERRRAQKRRYWNETFQKKKRRINGSLEAAEFKDLAARAEREGRSPWQQLLVESRAYRSGEYAPSETVEQELQVLNVQCRKIGTNLNQMARHSNRLRRLLAERPVQRELQTLLDELKGVIASLWQVRENMAASGEKKKEPRA